jgi:hypothetical protein
MEVDAGTGRLNPADVADGAFRGMLQPTRMRALLSAMGTGEQGGEGK